MKPKEEVKQGEINEEVITLPELKEDIVPEIVIPDEKKPEIKSEDKPIVPIKPTSDVLGDDNELPFKKPNEEPKPEDLVEEEKPEEDIFKLEEIKPDEPGTDKPAPEPKFDFLEFGKELGIEVKDNSLESFKEAHTNALATAKQTVEVDLSKFNEKEKIIIDYLHQGGTLEDFFKPLMAFDNFLSQADDVKVKDWLLNEEGVAQNQLDERLGQIIDEGQFDAYVDKVNTAVNELRTGKYNQVLATVKQTNDNYQAKVQAGQVKERTELKQVLDNTKEFMGISIPDNVKDILKREIDTGAFTDKNDNAQTQMKARLFDLFGDKVLSKVNKDWQKKVDDAYNRGVIGQQKRLHSIPPKPDEQPGHNSTRIETDKGKLPDMANVDADARQVF